MKNNKYCIGLIGYGSVGKGIIDYYLRSSEPKLSSLEIIAIGVHDINKERTMPLSNIHRPFPSLIDDPMTKIINNPLIDIVVDAVGGNVKANTASRKYLYQAIANGKHVVTCNKAVLCDELVPLTELANKKKVNLRYEAAVCGGIPIIQTLQKYYANDEIERVSGIINGTSNYILSEMHQGKTLIEALKEAQSNGYAEADYTNDVEGFDALHKLVLLASIAFHTKINPNDVLREGIMQVSHHDIYYLKQFLGKILMEDHAIKLIGSAERKENNVLEL